MNNNMSGVPDILLYTYSTVYDVHTAQYTYSIQYTYSNTIHRVFSQNQAGENKIKYVNFKINIF